MIDNFYKILILSNAEKNNWYIKKIDNDTYFLAKKKNKNCERELKLLLNRPYNLKEIINLINNKVK